MSEVGHLSIFFPTLEGGGAQKNMLNLARGFRDRGLRVDLVLAKAEGPYLSQVPSGIRVIDFGHGHLLTSLPSLVRYLRQERPGVFVSALDYANVFALWARRIARVPTPVVVSVRNTLSQTAEHATQIRQRLIPFLVRVFYPWADAIVAVSRGVANDLAHIKGLSRKDIHVIYNPVVTSELLAAARAPTDHPWFSPGEPPVVLGTGRLTPQKDFPTLIRAFAFMRARRPGRLVILGEGEERPRLEALVSQLGIEDDVVLPG
ncbi:MAG: glycosyltransferase, partial [Thermoplasmata archaeon]